MVGGRMSFGQIIGTMTTFIACTVVLLQVFDFMGLSQIGPEGYVLPGLSPGNPSRSSASRKTSAVSPAEGSRDNSEAVEEESELVEEGADEAIADEEGKDDGLEQTGTDVLEEEGKESDSDTAEKTDVPAAILKKPIRKSDVPLCIALAADLAQFENTVVVINSTMMHAREPKLLRFRIITMKGDEQELMQKLRERLPHVPDLQSVLFDPFVERVSRLVGGSSSGRQELFTVLNFAAFYLHDLLPKMGRVLYLDTDVVVQADLQAYLSEKSMYGHSVGGAKDCSQRVGKYIKFDKIKEMKIAKRLPLTLDAKPTDCVVNRGVVLVDIDVWRTTGMTEMIEKLVQIHLSEDGPLWQSGVSQPPFLLAIAGRYYNIGWEYNVRGLGRSDMTVDEVRLYKHKIDIWPKYMDNFLFVCHSGPRRNTVFAPRVMPQAHVAKVLHFNGRLKPMGRGRCPDRPLPIPSRLMKGKERQAFEHRPLCSCGDGCMQECAGLWWKYNTRAVSPVGSSKCVQDPEASS